MFRHFILSIVSLSLGLAACSNGSVEQVNIETSQTSEKEGFSYPFPLADFSDAAERLLNLSPNGVAIGEVHGQLAGIMLLEAMTDAALKRGKKVLVLHEFAPIEAGLDIRDIPKNDFRIYDMTSKELPLWTDNIDKRATWELHAFFEKINTMPNVELSNLMDMRLNPLPNRLKAHGFAERWNVAQIARPESYIIALGGNYHTSTPIKKYDLDVTNSMCRYADERLDTKITCITVDNWLSPNENCKAGQQAIVLKGQDIVADWDYVVLRPDRCVVQAHWVKAPQ